MTEIVDSHAHVWDADQADYPWLPEVPSLRPRYELADVAATHRSVGVAGVVLVQAADNVEDTANMLRAARADERVLGVVGWIPLRDLDTSRRLLDDWHDEPIVGVRHLAHRDPDPELLIDRSVQPTLAELGRRGLTFDVCAETPHLLGLVPQLARAHPEVTFVIDHLGKPPIAARGWEPWAGLLTAAAAYPNVVAKLSGLNTAAGPDWTGRDFAPFVDHALSVFGPDRLMYGGDWPFALLAAQDYLQIWNGLDETLADLPGEQRAAILAGTARRVYRLGPGPDPDGGPST